MQELQGIVDVLGEASVATMNYITAREKSAAAEQALKEMQMGSGTTGKQQEVQLTPEELADQLRAEKEQAEARAKMAQEQADKAREIKEKQRKANAEMSEDEAKANLESS
jgi:hypothetical protein